ncbi:hypothetical protein [Leptotrichia sp. oral taxon 847]|uniref:hypothetical protein n=1 Tax=Leptotrichia sp. oral taxon 847 TaxID=1785996 RepID=UPI000767FC9C|nr:hypothetical protein [Leptotrichia sp. oral taxon 847]AMD94825.1 hypothetical protein AXF11_03945 [Leptotrichia sp. oral taxon 847]
MENIIKNLINLINSCETKNSEKFSFGFLYKYEVNSEKYTLFIGIKDGIKNGKLQKFASCEKFCSKNYVHKIIFKKSWELVKYVLWEKFEIELFEILNLQKEEMDNWDFDYFENENFNIILKELILEIRKNLKLKKIAKRFFTELEAYEFEIDKIFEEMNGNETSDFTFNNSLYQGYDFSQNCEFFWGNITNFRILDFKINFKERFYFLSIKFQIESFYEEKNILNYYDIEIPDFLSFPSKEKDEELLKNNLLLIFYLDSDILYSMIFTKILGNEKNIIFKSAIQNGIGIENLKKEVFFQLTEKFSGKFFIGSENIFLKSDVKKIFYEFLKRNHFKCEKNLFIKFLIMNTGIKIYDFRNIDSFFTMVEEIFLEYMKGE